MKKSIAKLIYKITGWKLKIDVQTNEIQPSVLIAAPHTSNWDLLYAMCAFWIMEVPIKFFIKESHTKSFYGFFVKALGGIGVNRNQKNNLTEYAANLLKTNPKLVIMVPAEGTRKRVESWRKGFYTIAQKAEVPITLAFLDYKFKISGIGKLIHPTGNYEQDMLIIEDFYKNINACYPELYNQKIFKRSHENT